MSEEWCREQLKNLQIRDLRTNTLNEIKNQLIKHPNDEVEISTNFIQSQELLDCLEDTTKEQTELACDILSICMSNLTIEQTVNNSNVLERSLNHPNDNVKVLGINGIKKTLHSPHAITDVNIVLLLIKCLESDESKVGTPCIEILTKLLPRFIDISTVKARLAYTLMNANGVVQCRTYELAVKLAQQSPELLKKVEFILQKALQDIDNNDILLQLNVLELFSDLPLKEHGLVYVENKGLLVKFSKKLDAMEENPINHILIPGIIRFFGNISIMYPSKIFNGYPNFIDFVFKCIMSNDLSVKPVALDTLGNFGRTAEGKICLDSAPLFHQILKFLAEDIVNCPTEIKIRSLNSLAILFDPNTQYINNQITCVCQSWLRSLYPTNTLEQVMNFCKTPFADIKLATIGFLRALIQHEFGQEALLRTGGFMEYLLNRNTETDKDMLQEKYGCIKLLSESRVFNAQQILQLKQYLQEGPFYVQGITEVTLDES